MTAAPSQDDRLVIHRDERTVLVENASFRWAYLFLSFGLLALVAYRSLMFHESPWELLLLVVLGGAVPAAYQAYHHVLTSRWAIRMIGGAVAAALVGAALVLIRTR